MMREFPGIESHELTSRHRDGVRLAHDAGPVLDGGPVGHTLEDYLPPLAFGEAPARSGRDLERAIRSL